jgi:hypothetical protein
MDKENLTFIYIHKMDDRKCTYQLLEQTSDCTVSISYGASRLLMLVTVAAVIAGCV